jgi:hypothetical protein
LRAYGNTNAAPYASAPAVGLTGDTYWNTTEQALYVSNGTVWVRAGPDAVYAARVYRAANLTLTTGVEATISFDGSNINRGSMWAAGAPTQILLPVTGLWLVSAEVNFSNTNGTGGRMVIIRNKAGTGIQRLDVIVPNLAAWHAIMVTSLYTSSDPTDYVTIGAWQSSGGNMDLTSTIVANVYRISP